MSTFVGALVSLVIGHVADTHISGDLDDFTTPFDETVRAALAINQTEATFAVDISPVSVVVSNWFGVESFRVSAHQVFFEQIHTIIANAPFGQGSLRNFGNLLTSILVDIEVWNGFTETLQTLQTATASGSGVTLIDPYGTPLDYNPLQARIYQLRVLSTGPATVNNTIVFDFAGIIEPVPHFIGVRVVPFPFEPDWAEGLIEGKEFLTDVIVAYDDSEQRVALRALPRRFFVISPKTFSTQEAAYLEALVYGWMDQKYGVPAWHDLMVMNGNVVAGDTVINVDDTALRDLIIGQTVLIWDGYATWEARNVLAFDATSVTLDDALEQGYRSRFGRVLPVFIGSLSSEEAFERPARDAGLGQFTFMLEARVP